MITISKIIEWKGMYQKLFFLGDKNMFFFFFQSFHIFLTTDNDKTSIFCFHQWQSHRLFFKWGPHLTLGTKINSRYFNKLIFQIVQKLKNMKLNFLKGVVF